MTPDEEKTLNGLKDDIIEAFEKAVRPTDAEGNVEPMGTVEVKLSQETKMYLGGLLLGGIVVNTLANGIAQNLRKK